MKDLIGKSHKPNLKGLLAIAFLYYSKTTFYFYHFTSFIEPLWYIKYEKMGFIVKSAYVYFHKISSFQENFTKCILDANRYLQKEVILKYFILIIQ